MVKFLTELLHHLSQSTLTIIDALQTDSLSVGGVRNPTQFPTHLEVQFEPRTVPYRRGENLKGVEEQGIDPCASCMQSRRSTI